MNARDITVYKNHIDHSTSLDDGTKKMLMEARATLDGTNLNIADKHDVADNLGKLTEELEKPDKEEGLIGRYFRRIKEVAPTVATVLESIKAVSEIVGGMS